MFVPQSQVRIWLCTVPTDMRKSFTGLSALVRNQLRDNPLNGQMYVFVNRRRNLMKLLYFDRTGYAIWSKQLARGQFVFDRNGGLKRSLSATELSCLLDGIEIRDTRRYRRFTLPDAANT